MVKKIKLIGGLPSDLLDVDDSVERVIEDARNTSGNTDTDKQAYIKKYENEHVLPVGRDDETNTQLNHLRISDLKLLEGLLNKRVERLKDTEN